MVVHVGTAREAHAHAAERGKLTTVMQERGLLLLGEGLDLIELDHAGLDRRDVRDAALRRVLIE